MDIKITIKVTFNKSFVAYKTKKKVVIHEAYINKLKIGSITEINKGYNIYIGGVFKGKYMCLTNAKNSINDYVNEQLNKHTIRIKTVK